MIDAIGDNTVKGATRTEPAAVVSERLFAAQQEQLRAERPVEGSQPGDSVRLREREAEPEKGEAKYVQEKNRLFFEKYDKNGELVLRMPPQKLPVDEVI